MGCCSRAALVRFSNLAKRQNKRCFLNLLNIIRKSANMRTSDARPYGCGDCSTLHCLIKSASAIKITAGAYGRAPAK